MENDETTNLIFTYFTDFCARHAGLPPTYREIMAGTGVSSTSVVNHHLRKLVRKGRLKYIRSADGTKGRYVVVGATWRWSEVP